MGKDDASKNVAALEQSKKPTNQAFSDQQKVGKGKQECPLKDKKKKCDFADIIIERVPVNLGKKYVKEGPGKWVEKEPTEKPFVLKLSEIIAKKCEPSLQILAGPEKPGFIGSVTGKQSQLAKKKVKITSTMAEGPCDGAKHPHIAVVGSPNVLEYIGPGKCASISFDVFRNEGQTFSQKLGFSLASVWPCNIPPRIYTIDAQTCGNRSSGTPITGVIVQVEVFPCEQYALSLKFPAFKKGSCKIESTRKYDSKKKRYVTETSGEVTSQSGYFDKKEGSSTKITQTVRPGGTTLKTTQSETLGDTTTSRENTYGPRGGFKDELTTKTGDTDFELKEGKSGNKYWEVKGSSAPADQIVFELSRSGSTESLGGDITKFLNWLQYTYSEFESLKDTIKNFMPQVGASFDFSFSFLEGSFGASWGYKEHSDHRVFFAWKAEVAMKLLSATISVSFGFQMSSLLVAKLQLDISGEVIANIERERSKPEQPMKGDGGAAAVKGSIDGKVSGVAQAGAGWIKVSREVGAKTGYEIGAKLSVSESEFALEGTAKFKGVFAYITSKDINEPETTDLYEIVSEGKEHKFNLPTPPALGDFESHVAQNGHMLA